MTRLEFVSKLEDYEKKQRRYKKEYFISGIILLIFAIFPSSISYFNENMFGFTTTTFSLLSSLCLAKSWSIKRGTEEHVLLINAMELLSASDDT